MDELFGEVGFAQADLARKQKIENDIGLTALLNGGSAADAPGLVSPTDSGSKVVADDSNDEFVEKAT